MRAARHPRIYEAAASTPGFPLGLFPVYIQDIGQLHIDAVERCASDDERRQRILPETTAGLDDSGHELTDKPELRGRPSNYDGGLRAQGFPARVSSER